MMGRLVLLLVFSGAAMAQSPSRQPSPPQPRRFVFPYTYVSGRVIDADTKLAITGARVFIRCIGSGGAPNEVTLVTGNGGAFGSQRYNEQGCIVQVYADGYVASREDIERGPVSIPPPSGDPDKSLLFALHQQAEIYGTVIDPDTEKPVAGLTIWAQWSDFERGKRRLSAAADASSTDADGRFRLKNLPPGQYFLQVSQPEQERVEARAMPAVKVSGYARSFWPGGAHESALPLYLTAGARLNAGSLFVRQQPLYRIHAKIEVPQCAAFRKYRFTLWQQQGPEFVPRVKDILDCDAPFTLRNLTAGRWWLESRLDGALAEWAEAELLEVEIQDKDRTLALHPLPPLQIPFKIVGERIAFPTIPKAALVPAGGPTQALPLPVDVTMPRVALAAPASEKAELRMIGLPDGMCIKSVRYNGGLAEDGIFVPNRSAPSHLLEVELSSSPPLVEGVVRNGEKPVPGALVVLAPWPSALRADWPNTFRARSGGAGYFKFDSLPPGSYRAFSIDPGYLKRLEEPGVLLRLIGQASEWDLREGQRTLIPLEPVEP